MFFSTCKPVFRSLLLLVVAAAACVSPHAVFAQHLPSVALLDFGQSRTAHRVTDCLANNLKASSDINLLDRDQAQIAAGGAGYNGSLNLSLKDARDLGDAIGCDFFIIGDAQTLRRSASTSSAYFESYASIFLVSGRTGRLVIWQRPSLEKANSDDAEQALIDDLTRSDVCGKLLAAIKRTLAGEKLQRESALEGSIPVIEEAPESDAPSSNGLRLPRPYRRLRPAYPDTAAKADAEGTVDVLVDLDAEGEVQRVEVIRWSGFGLDEATVATVRQLHFFPAMRDGIAIPLRVMLRYNFHKSSQ